MLLQVEVADRSLAWDRGPNLGLDTRYGVPAVWLADLAVRAFASCREPGPEGYAEWRRISEGVATPMPMPDDAVDLAAPMGFMGGRRRPGTLKGSIG